MWTRTYSRSTTTRPDVLWQVLADVAGWGSWNNGIDSITVHGQPAAGTTFAMTPLGGETVTSTIVEFEPPHLLTDLTELDGVSVRVAHRLIEEPRGGSVISFVIAVSGEVPDDVLTEIGEMVSADFDDVISSLDDFAQSSRAVETAGH